MSGQASNQGELLRILDLFCCGGGAGVGYARAGFLVTGVDIEPQPNYPFEFWCMDALSLNYEQLALFDVIHASPPCQQYSCSTALARKRGKVYPDLYHETKRMLVASGKPHIIENVQGSPIRGGLGLCGTMFGLGVFRHRLFESNIPLKSPEKRCSCSRERIDKHHYFTVAGNDATKAQGLPAMGIDWEMTKHQMNQAIPPCYTEFIGRQIMSSCYSSQHENPALISESRMNTQGTHLVQRGLYE